ncbi:MAG: hypothetical protein HYV96_12540 [Opitutae bacterium]|nr:hypothetical protein [Opitutae bacterium]
MKTKLTALALALVTLFALATPKTAKANDAGAAIGGFIGGVIVGSVLADQHRGPDAVVVETGYGYHRGSDRCDEPRGYWRDVHTRIWIPGGWIVERDHWGRHCRRYIEGHYEIRTERVWVAANDYGHGRYDRHDRYGRRW